MTAGWDVLLASRRSASDESVTTGTAAFAAVAVGVATRRGSSGCCIGCDLLTQHGQDTSRLFRTAFERQNIQGAVAG